MAEQCNLLYTTVHLFAFLPPPRHGVNPVSSRSVCTHNWVTNLRNFYYYFPFHQYKPTQFHYKRQPILTLPFGLAVVGGFAIV